MSNVQSRLETVKRDGYDFRIGDFISQGFHIFGKNAAIFIGFLLVTVFISIVLNFIPILGDLISFLTSGALSAGYFIVAHKTNKDEYVEFSNFFDGFKDWVQLFINTLIVTLMLLIGLIPAIIFIIKNYGLGNFDFRDTEQISELMRDFGILYIFLYSLAILFLSLLVTYSSLFIVFDKLNAWDAVKESVSVVSKSIASHIVFFVAWIFIFVISAIPIGLGLLVTVPAFYCSIYYAWREITRYGDDMEVEDDFMKHLIE